MTSPDAQPTPRTDPPIAGMWVVDSTSELTPEFMERAIDALESAAAEGKQVVVMEGIEFRWRPIRVEAADAAALDVETLERALQDLWRTRNADGSFVWNLPIPPDEQTARALAAAYARLRSEGTPDR
jgi:hypothetical protein